MQKCVQLVILGILQGFAEGRVRDGGPTVSPEPAGRAGCVNETALRGGRGEHTRSGSGETSTSLLKVIPPKWKADRTQAIAASRR